MNVLRIVFTVLALVMDGLCIALIGLTLLTQHLSSSGLFGVVFNPMPDKALAAFMDGLAQFGLGYSWGGYESLIVPAHITRTVSKFEAEGPVIRIHAGLEDADDLIADLAAGFDRIASLR